MENKPQNTNESVKNERSSKEIKQDLAARGEEFSRTVEQLGERIEEKLDWREQVRENPFWAVGVVTGLGFIASKLVRRRTTPMERLLENLDSSVRGGLSGNSPSLIKITLMGIAARAATNMLKNAPAVVSQLPVDKDSSSV